MNTQTRGERVEVLRRRIPHMLESLGINMPMNEQIKLIYDNNFSEEDSDKVMGLLKAITSDGRYEHSVIISHGCDNTFGFGRSLDHSMHNKYSFARMGPNVYLTWMELIVQYLEHERAFFYKVCAQDGFQVTKHDEYTNKVVFLVNKHDICITKLKDMA